MKTGPRLFFKRVQHHPAGVPERNVLIHFRTDALVRE
jgi:hypothetical protein